MNRRLFLKKEHACCELSSFFFLLLTPAKLWLCWLSFSQLGLFCVAQNTKAIVSQPSKVQFPWLFLPTFLHLIALYSLGFNFYGVRDVLCVYCTDFICTLQTMKKKKLTTHVLFFKRNLPWDSFLSNWRNLDSFIWKQNIRDFFYISVKVAFRSRLVRVSTSVSSLLHLNSLLQSIIVTWRSMTHTPIKFPRQLWRGFQCPVTYAAINISR